MTRWNEVEVLRRGATCSTVRMILSQVRALTPSCSAFVGVPLEDHQWGFLASSEGRDEQQAIQIDLHVADLRPQARRYTLEEIRAGKSETDRDWLACFERGDKNAITTALFVPIVVNGDVIGMIGLGDSGRDFTEDDLELASSFGEFAAMALCGARSEDRVRATVEGLQRSVTPHIPVIVTICSMCRKVRGRDGSWHMLSPVVDEERRPTFSHGLCPKCAKTFYGHIDDTDLQPPASSLQPEMSEGAKRLSRIRRSVDGRRGRR